MTAGPAVGRLILVDEELCIGSEQEGDGALGGDPLLAAAHALLMPDHTGNWLVRDLGSGEPTFLNGEAVRGVEALRRGDMLRLGESRLLVVEGALRELD